MYYPKTRSYLDRKMCVVLPHILARGPLRAPVQPPAGGSFCAWSPSRTKNRIAGSIHSRETSLSLRPSIKRAIAPPLKSHSQGPWRHSSPSPAPRTMQNVWSFDPHSGEPSCSPEHPMTIPSRSITSQCHATYWQVSFSICAATALRPNPSHSCLLVTLTRADAD